MSDNLKTLKSRFYVAKHQRTSKGEAWPYADFEAWHAEFMRNVPEGADPLECRTKYSEDGGFEVTQTRSGKGRRKRPAKPDEVSVSQTQIAKAIEVSTYVANLLEEPIEVDMQDLDEAAEELLK